MNDGAPDPLVDWRKLTAPRRLKWWEDLWLQTIALAERYRMPLRSGWWQDNLQVEALAAFCAWLELYDSAAYGDPPGKLQLLWELDHLKKILGGRERAFDAPRDRPGFEQHLAAIGCHGTNQDQCSEQRPSPAREKHRRELETELAELTDRLRELGEREQLLQELEPQTKQSQAAAAHARQDLAEVRRTIAELRRRRDQLHYQLDETPAS